MYCLIDETGAIAKRTTASTAEWRGLTISNLAALSPEDRRATGVYLQLPATVHPGEFERAVSAEYDIDHEAGAVQERFIIEPLPAAEVAAILRTQAKAAREIAVQNIQVTTSSGHIFDGDEISQGRMARAIIAMQATGTPSVTWVLADNTVIEASADDLTEALALAGAAQAAIWVI